MSLKQRVTNALESGLDISIEVLKFVDSAAGVFPPLKNVTGSALFIAQTVQSFRQNRAEWERFGIYVTEMVAEVAIRTHSYDLSTKEAIPWKMNLEQLATALTGVVTAVLKCRDKSKRLLAIIDPRSYNSSGGQIADLRKDLDQALAAFQLMTNLTVGHTLADVMRNDKSILSKLDSLDRRVLTAEQNSILEKLQFAKLGHYDESSLCLERTRTALNRQIMDWCHNTGNDEKRIMLLMAVAGAGKSAIAHTIAKECATQGILLSSFFFKASEQSQPTLLFSDMARSLAVKSMDHRNIIISTLESDPKLATASFTTQFKELVQGPLRFRPPSSEKPMVVIIDALDECDTAFFDALAEILCEEIPRLSPSIKFFVTSRQVDRVDRYLPSDFVQRLTIDLAGEVNVQDCEIYVRSQLEKLSKAYPRSEISSKKDALAQEITSRADGLFIWISTIFNYLKGKSADPMATLRKLLDTGVSRKGVPAEKRMDGLYTSVLARCDWEDGDFVHDYPIVLGAILASERPLSMMAWDSILSPFLRSTVERTVMELSPLLTGIREIHAPIRILHQSFRDFIVDRAAGGQRCIVETKEVHERMALRCFQIMNAELPGVKDLGRILSLDEKDPLPPIPHFHLTEELRYASRYAHAHARVVHTPQEDLQLATQAFLDRGIMEWIELCVRTEGYISTALFPDWVESYIDTSSSGQIRMMAGVLYDLSFNLSFVLRLNEAYESSKDSVRLYRVLVSTDQLSYTSELALSLLNLSHQLHSLGQHSKALPPIEESISLFRKLVVTKPSSHTDHLADSLHDLSLYLYHLGQHSKALPPSEESVNLYRKLRAANPASHTFGLATVLNNLSIRLSEVGRYSEALSSIEESVDLYRKLVSTNRAECAGHLANALDTLSMQLSNVGRHSDALPPIEESVDLLRELVEAYPVSYPSWLAMALNTLSNRLSDIGKYPEALLPIQESVFLRRKLAATHPAAYTSDLASSLETLSNTLLGLGRYTEAFDASKEALSLYRPLFTECPPAHTRPLQRALKYVARALEGLGRHDEASAFLTEADSLS